MGAAKPIKRCFLSHPYPPREEGGVQGWRLKADGAGPKEDWTLLALRRRDTAQAPWPPRLGPSCLSKPSSGRRERDGRKGGSPGSHPFPTLPSLQPQAPPDSEAPAAPPLPGPRSLSSARGTPACAYLFVPYRPAGSHAQTELVSRHLGGADGDGFGGPGVGLRACPMHGSWVLAGSRVLTETRKACGPKACGGVDALATD